MTFKEYIEKNKYLLDTNIKSLDLHDLNISDLCGIEEYTDLDYLRAFGNKIMDLEPLRNLKKLKVLSIWGNNISDIDPIKDLTDIRELYISENMISDISCLKNLDLIDFTFDNNLISNIDIISNMNNLKRLIIYNKNLPKIYNKFNSVSPNEELYHNEIIELKNIIKYERRKNIISLL